MGSPPEDERRALSQYLREIRRFPLLTREDERRLLEQVVRGDDDAKTKIVESNLGFVVKVAMEYRSLGVPFEDLLNEGNLGLIEATERYDPDRGTKFITYAIWWIRKTILKAIEDRSLVVRVPPNRRRKMFELRKAEARLLGQLGREPTREEIAQHLSVGVERVDNVRRLYLAHVSLDRQASEEDATTLLDRLMDAGTSVEDRLLREEAGILVTHAFRGLPPREQAVLGWRLALGGQPPLTLRQVGARLSLSRERVRQIENQAKRRLRRLLARSLRAASENRARRGNP